MYDIVSFVTVTDCDSTVVTVGCKLSDLQLLLKCLFIAVVVMNICHCKIVWIVAVCNCFVFTVCWQGDVAYLAGK